MSPVLSAGAIGVGTLFASRIGCNLQRSLGVLLIGVGLTASNPAFADQSLLVQDNGTVRCEASLKDLTRISLKGDKFASVSKVQAAGPNDDFQVVNEPLRGDIYVSVPDAFSKKVISFFGTSQKGYVYKFVCTVSGEEAKQVFVANADVEQPANGVQRISAATPPNEAASRLVKAMYEQTPVEGYQVNWRPLTPVNVGTLRVQLIGEYRGSSLTGELLKIKNMADKPVTLSEDQVGPPDAVAESITKPNLNAKEETTAFVVLRTPVLGDAK